MFPVFQTFHTIRLLRFLAVLCLFAALPASAQVSDSPSASTTAIMRDLYDFQSMGSVLYVAAHPDDENNELLAYLARGRHYRTAYLSLNRGDGGQNVLGPQFGEELGLIRTEELLAARRVDGGRQYFTRAVDFGFSKDYRQTLKIWDQQEVLADTVRVIREFRPDVVMTRFSLIPGGTHGHHTASAMLALDAFKVAGDPNAFPEQLREGLAPWQPKRIFWNVGGFQTSETNGSQLVRMNIGGIDPLSSQPYAAIAARSRSMHKTQGLGNFNGYRGSSGPRYERFELLAGDPATNDVMDGVDTDWSRVSGGADIATQIGKVIDQFDTNNPAASVLALLAIKKTLAPLASDDPVVNEKRTLLDHIIQECLGLTVQTTVPNAEVVPGEPLKMRLSVSLRSDVVPVRWMAARYPAIKAEFAINTKLSTNQPASCVSTKIFPADAPLSQPYWLREVHPPGMFVVDDPSLIGRPENPPVFPIEQVFEVGGQTLVIPDQPVQTIAARASGDTRRLDVISPVSIALSSDVRLFAPGASNDVVVTVTSARSDVTGTLRLDAPAGWTVSPSEQSFHFKSVGAGSAFTFSIIAPAQPSVTNLTAEVQIDGKTYDNERVVIDYPHIPILLLQPPARLKAVCLDMATRGHNLGYLPGAGDSVAQCLQDMGYNVTLLTGADLTSENLKKFDAVVIGIRAFNVRTDLVPHLPALFAFVQDGGNVIEQYNRPGGDLKTDQFTPYSLELSSDRVTDPNAPMTFLAPDHPALNVPNKITSADFESWVQERGIYFPSQWDDHFTPILACNDVGEAPLKGSLLVAQYGKGYFVYTGLDFFRQLPAGVPGAYRLFANLISLGK
ncbi:MAG TPA: PIG-L family deacetylase [Verrucomicrobiae bacterium]|jgi:LmbE family N-acetylglucosaminyl deacetylase